MLAWILHNGAYLDDQIVQFQDYMTYTELVATQSNAQVIAMASTRCRHFIVDSGASFRLIAKASLSDEEFLSARRANISIVIRTAGSPEPIQADEVADTWIESLREIVTAYVMPDVIPLLSMLQIVGALSYDIEERTTFSS